MNPEGTVLNCLSLNPLKPDINEHNYSLNLIEYQDISCLMIIPFILITSVLVEMLTL